jgi:hypothetical protein
VITCQFVINLVGVTHGSSESGHICFKTELLLKESGKKLQNEVILNPLKKDEIFTMLNSSGF